MSMACSDEFNSEGEFVPSLSTHYLSPSQTNFNNSSPDAFSQTFRVESYQTSWAFSDISSWFSLTPASGTESETVTISVEENTDADGPRTGIFYLQSTFNDWEYSRAMSVTQGRAVPWVRLDDNDLIFSGSAQSRKLTVSANCEWTSECSYEWVTLESDSESGSLVITVDANTTNAYRTAVAYIVYDNDTKAYMINITQSPALVSSSDDVLNFYNVASKYSVTVDSEIAWTAEASESWISIRPDNGNAGKTEMTIEVTPNTAVSQRTGYVAIKTNGVERIQITVIQRGIYIEADDMITFGSLPESKVMSINSNTTWALVSKPDWVSLSKESGEGDGQITVSVTDNPNTSTRTGEIVFGQPGLTLQRSVEIIQRGKSLTPDTSLLEFSDKASQMNFSLKSDTKWVSTRSADWFDSTPTSGSGDATVTVSVEENTSTDERIGTLSYAYLDKSTNVNVHQLAKYMTIDNHIFDFDSKGGSHTVEIYTNDDWTAEIESGASWLNLSKTSGSGNAVIMLVASDNASVSARSATVLIKTKYTQEIRILVSQQARYLTLSSQSILFFAAGGTSVPVSVDTNGEYAIRTGSSWFTVNQGPGNTFTVVATANNTNGMRSGKITIALTDLTAGSYEIEMSVIQAPEGGTFIVNGYPEDSDWTTVSNGTLSLTFKGYTSDKDWNNSFIGTLTLNITGYPSDNDWNK